MKKNLFIPLAALMLLVGCDYNDKYFDGLDDNSRPIDQKKIEYTLTGDDYAAIANNDANKALAKSRGDADVKALEALKTTKTFTSKIASMDYLPAFIAAKWYTADDKSVVKITCEEEGSEGSLSKDAAKFSNASWYTLTDDNYKTIWGGIYHIVFSPSKPAANSIPSVLSAKYPAAQTGDKVYVSYNVSESDPTETYVLREGFDAVTSNTVIDLPQWNNVLVKGTNKWKGYSVSGNVFASVDAFKHDADLESYLVSSAIVVKEGMVLNFDALYANYKKEGGLVSVLIYKDLAEEDITSEKLGTVNPTEDITNKFKIPTSGSSLKTMSYDLKAYANNSIRIAFRYVGNGKNSATSTIRIDNVAVKSGQDQYAVVNLLYTYNGSAWIQYEGKEFRVLSQSHFTTMGLSSDYFGGTVKADSYVPNYLTLSYPYALKDDIKFVAYKYYNGTDLSIKVSEYKLGENRVWNRTSDVVTNQFKRSKGEWKYSPDVTIELLPIKNQAETMAFYQAIIDYVAADPNKGGDYYQTGYKNAEFYYGASAFGNNFSFYVSAWRTSCVAGPKAYGALSEEDLKALMRKRLPEAFIPALEKIYPEADLLPSGAELNYIINFGIYEGSAISQCTHTIVYKVIGKGKFEYVPDSFQPIQ